MFAHCLEVKDKGRRLDPTLVATDVADEDGNPLVELVVDVASQPIDTTLAKEYALRLQREWIRREAVRRNAQVERALRDPSKPLEQVLQIWEEHARKLGLATEPDKFALTAEDIVSQCMDPEYREKEGKPMPLGFAELDELMRGGIRRGQMMIVAGRPGMGKTTLATNMMEYALDHGVGILFDSVEMTSIEWGDIILQARAGASVGLDKFHLNKGSKADEALYHMAAEDVRGFPLQYVESDTLSELRRHVERAKLSMPTLGIVCVDYVQLMRGVSDGKNREQEIAALSRGMKGIARDYKVGVIALAQINRNVELRTDKRPMAADLRDSGSLEQDADVILMVYRGHHYDGQNEGKAELIVAKHRAGKVGTVVVDYQPARRRFVCPQLARMR